MFPTPQVFSLVYTYRRKNECNLTQFIYLGNDTYPAIIDKEIFDKAEEVRDKRAKDLGRVVELAAFTSPPPKERFKMRKADNKMPVDPFERAEYLYSLIESEE